MKRLKRNTHKRQALRRLVRTALRGWMSDRSWQAIAALQMRGSAPVLALAQTLTRSANWRRRCLGLYIASQLRQRHGRASAEYGMQETHTLLLAGLDDLNDEVVLAAVSEAGHRPHPQALLGLLRLATHPDAELRQEVAVALGRYEDAAAVSALLELARDPDARVRDWATFGIGSQQGVDTPAVRALLCRNLVDPDDDVRGEALVGLAKRGDAEALNYLLANLDSGCRVYELEAAATMASPLLRDILVRISSEVSCTAPDGFWFSSLQAAISACSANSTAAHQ